MRNPVSRSNPMNMYDMKPNFRRIQQSHKLPQRKHRHSIQRQMETEEHDDDECDVEEVDEQSKSDQDDDESCDDVENNEINVPEYSGDENGNEQCEEEDS